MPKLTMKQFSFAAISPVIEEISIFVRNIIIARLCGAETLGSFLFILILLRLGHMSTDLSVERFIIAQSGGDRVTAEDRIRAGHSLMLCRAVILVLAVVCFSFTAQNVLSADIVPWLIAMILIQGVTNLGYHTEQIGLTYHNQVIMKAVIPMAGVGGLLIVLLYRPDLSAALAVVTLTSAVQMIVSHCLSHHRYALGFCPVLMKKMIRFGLPLLGASAVMFWSMQGDRVIIGTLFTAEEFARFSISFQLALVPVLILGKISLLIGLPLAAAKMKAEKRGNATAVINQFLAQALYLYTGAAFIFVSIYYWGANILSGWVFGPEFYTAPIVILLIGLCQAGRIMRTPSSIIAQAAGHTVIPFKANIIRLLGTAFGAVFLLSSGGITDLLLAALCAELLAFLYQTTALKTALMPAEMAGSQKLVKGL